MLDLEHFRALGLAEWRFFDIFLGDPAAAAELRIESQVRTNST